MRLSRFSLVLVALLAACGDGTEAPATGAPAATPQVRPAEAPPAAPIPTPAAVPEPAAPPPMLAPAAPAPPTPAPLQPEPTPVTPEPAAATPEPAAAAADPAPPAAGPATPEPRPAPASPADPAALALAAGDAVAGARYGARCSACHSFEEGGDVRVGPTLFGVFGNRVGADLNFAYSEAFLRLRDEGATWTAERLEAFLADPPAAIPGTAMTVPMVRDAEDRIDVIAWLATLVPTGVAAEGGDVAGGDLLARIAAAYPAAGEEEAARCSGCHTFIEGAPALIGPNLYGIVGAPMGRTEGFAYSFALRQRRDEGGVWTYDLLDAFLRSPQAALPGTSMGFTGINDDGNRANLIAWMRTQADGPFPIPARVGTVVAGLQPVAFLRQQASNGETLYDGACDGCHGTDLRGIEGLAPSLLSGAFAQRWFAGNAYDLFEYIRRNMPPNNRRGFTDFQYVNVVAYILRQNGFEANFKDAYLPVGADELRGIGLFQY